MNHLKQTLIVVVTVVATVALITFGFTFVQVNQERERLEADLEYRSSLLASAVKEPVQGNFANRTNQDLQGAVDRFAGDQRIAALGIVDNRAEVRAGSSPLVSDIPLIKRVAAEAMDSNRASTAFTHHQGQNLYVRAEPITSGQSVVGAVVVVQNASYIDTQIGEVWSRSVLRLLLLIIAFSLAILFTLRWIVHKPLQKLIASIRSGQWGSASEDSENLQHNSLFGPLFQEFSSVRESLARARVAAREAAKSDLERLDSPWTAERLHQFTKGLLKNRTIVTVSDREPYLHYKDGDRIRHMVPAGGLVTALDPVMQACGGLWIARSTGDADKLVVDKDDKLKVPPGDPSYTLKRVWLTQDEVRGHYEGFANRALWPLCHMVHTRPTFRQDDWETYKAVNRKFANAVLKEIKGKKNPIIIIQDYHFALLPRMVKDARPDAAVSIFWHIPWPNAEAFSICPWKKEILSGMLGADIIGFHTQVYCNNFVATISKEIEALVDIDHSAVVKGGHTSFVQPFPISVDFTGGKTSKKELAAQAEAAKKMRETLGIKSQYVGVGVERLDYTKGLLERVKAIELFLTEYPEYREEFTFVQIADPSRTTVKEYQEFDAKLTEEVERVNSRFKQGNWKPIIFIKEHRDRNFINNLFRASDFCLVTPLRDGMNLVAKEFVAARNDERGTLILSQYVGAVEELREALIVNPYDGKQTAEAIRQALEMQPAEQTRRMRKLRDTVKGHNVYHWSATMLKRIAELD